MGWEEKEEEEEEEWLCGGSPMGRQDEDGSLAPCPRAALVGAGAATEGLPVTCPPGLGTVPVPPQAPECHRALWPWWCCKVILALGALPRAAAMPEGCVQQRDVSSAGAAVVFRGCLAMGAFPDGYK